MDDGLTDAEARVWRPFLVASVRLLATLDEELRRLYGIDHHDFRMLVRVGEGADRPIRMSELAYFTSMDRSKITYRVKRMEKLGLMAREGHPDDRRGVNVRLTDRGREVLGSAKPEYARMLRGMLLESLDDNDRAVMERVFTQLMGRLHMDWHAFEG